MADNRLLRSCFRRAVVAVEDFILVAGITNPLSLSSAVFELTL